MIPLPSVSPRQCRTDEVDAVQAQRSKGDQAPLPEEQSQEPGRGAAGTVVRNNGGRAARSRRG